MKNLIVILFPALSLAGHGLEADREIDPPSSFGQRCRVEVIKIDVAYLPDYMLLTGLAENILTAEQAYTIVGCEKRFKNFMDADSERLLSIARFRAQLETSYKQHRTAIREAKEICEAIEEKSISLSEGKAQVFPYLGERDHLVRWRKAEAAFNFVKENEKLVGEKRTQIETFEKRVAVLGEVSCAERGRRAIEVNQ